MSSTNRGNDRDPLDDYPSPRWTVYRLLERRPLPGGLWYEPCAGAGNIIRAVDQVRMDVRWIANELNPKYVPELEVLKAKGYPIELITTEPAQDLVVGPGVSVAISNPAFTPSADILIKLLVGAPGALPVLLQRIGWGGGPRSELFRHLKPSVYQIPQRPSFKDIVSVNPKTGKKQTSSQDSTEYAWWVFDGLGKFEILDDTPDEVIKAEKAERRAAEAAMQRALAEWKMSGCES